MVWLSADAVDVCGVPLPDPFAAAPVVHQRAQLRLCDAQLAWLPPYAGKDSWVAQPPTGADSPDPSSAPCLDHLGCAQLILLN
jgi:hypothetical protein